MAFFISQLIRCARASSSYECFILRAVRLSNKLLGQGYVKERLRSSLRKLYGRYGDLIKQYEVPLSRMLHDILDDDHLQWHPLLIRHYTNFWPYYWSWPYNWIWLFTLLREVSVEHLQRVRHANRGRLPPPDTWSCSNFGTCKFSNVETKYLLNLSCFWTFEFRTSLGTSVFALIWDRICLCLLKNMVAPAVNDRWTHNL